MGFIVVCCSLLVLFITTSRSINIEVTNGLPGQCNDISYAPFRRVGRELLLFDFKKKMSWYHAAHYCRTQNLNLMSFETDEEYDNLGSYFEEHSDMPLFNKSFWISSSDTILGDNFRWGSTVDLQEYAEWSVAPNNLYNLANCNALAYIASVVELSTNNCYDEKYVLCEAANVRTITLNSPVEAK